MVVSRFASSSASRRTRTAGAALRRALSSSTANNPTAIYLHVGPSGDCWTGASIYAAKHLQPDYVKSIPLPPRVCIESLMERLEDDVKTTQQIYDNAEIPEELIEEMKRDAVV